MERTEGKTRTFNMVQEYNGYINKPTWMVALWINNDEGLQFHILEMARYAHGDAYELSANLKEHFEDMEYPEFPVSVYSDLLNWALAYVDWDELAEHFIEAAKEI